MFKDDASANLHADDWFVPLKIDAVRLTLLLKFLEISTQLGAAVPVIER